MRPNTSREQLEQLLLPDTPEKIRDLYLSFEDQARSHGFDLLEDDIVVLDTETTGLSFKTSELIEVAAARISGREIVDRFQTFVRPHHPIPAEITQLTGISDEDVAGAPRAKQVIAELSEFVGGMPVLAHNASFDRHFIEDEAGAPEVSENWIDTLALSRIALPRLSTHSLAQMAAAFGCSGVSHRAMADVEALAGMWRIILLGLSNLPEGVLAALAEMHPEVEWQYRPILAHLAAEEGPSTLNLSHIRHELVSGLPAEEKSDPAELEPPLKAPEPAEIEEDFAPGGLVDSMYPAFESRPEQVRMAQEVLHAFATSTDLAIEAGTGVGKSMAYLVPAVRFAKMNGITVGVATKTNALTDQLVSHELPALSQALPGGMTFFSLKGYDHYPCLRRTMQAMSAELPVDVVSDKRRTHSAVEQDMLTAIAVTIAFASQSPSGDLDALGIRWRSVPRAMLTTTPDQCQHGRCPFYPDGCLVHGARRRAASADVVVTNHSLLLRNVEADGKILPPIRHWIIDEAHSFESEARRQWAVEVSADGARDCFESLGGVKTGAIHALLAQAAGTEASTLITGLLTKAAASVSRASVACGDMFDELRGLTSLSDGGKGYESTTLWIDGRVRSTPEWARLSEVGEIAASRMEVAVHDLEGANEAIADALPNPDDDLLDATRELSDMCKSTRLILSGTDSSYVYSAQLPRSQRGIGTERLVAEKMDIGAELAERWLPEMMSVVFTSATMAVRDDFSHFEHAVGLDQLDASDRRCVQLDSSFDYDEQMGVVVCRDLPDPGSSGYLAALEDLLLDVHVAMGGSVLTLFTNRREMERVYEGLEPRLAEHGLDLIMQERGGANRLLRERFLSEETLSMFALKAFWEGFDAGGDTLRCVVIPKLPFASPRDPLVQERSSRESGAWFRYSLPEAVLTVKQASGRLIRTATDQGVLVLCDSRLVRKRYGNDFISSLQSRNCSVLPSSDVASYIEEWRSRHERL